MKNNYKEINDIDRKIDFYIYIYIYIYKLKNNS